ncbi:hypothetical protein B0H10DRAFT_2428078 [Mycena sp. CBHHK59/15]|nr:hypothetical protein B0H10DRAFT_2428078 [Mycena sp. CBHHK59/15]
MSPGAFTGLAPLFSHWGRWLILPLPLDTLHRQPTTYTQWYYSKLQICRNTLLFIVVGLARSFTLTVAAKLSSSTPTGNKPILGVPPALNSLGATSGTLSVTFDTAEPGAIGRDIAAVAVLGADTESVSSGEAAVVGTDDNNWFEHLRPIATIILTATPIIIGATSTFPINDYYPENFKCGTSRGDSWSPSNTRESISYWCSLTCSKLGQHVRISLTTVATSNS